MLYEEKFIEPSIINERPYDIMLHQALSIVKSCSGIKLDDLTKQLKNNFAFNKIDVSDMEEILGYLVKIELLEKLQYEVIIGVEGEKIVNNHDFYSMFQPEKNLKVINSGNKIGEIPYSPQVEVGENIFLSAGIWKIVFIDLPTNKIEVIKAKDGKKPIFFGNAGIIHQKIREKMFEIVYDKTEYDILDEPSFNAIETLRKDFAVFDVQSTQIERPFLVSETEFKLYTFAGTKINRTIELLLNIDGIKNRFYEASSMFEFDNKNNNLSAKDLLVKINNLTQYIENIDSHIKKLMERNPKFLVNFSKWGIYLPQEYQIETIKDKYFDIDSAKQFLETTKFIVN